MDKPMPLQPERRTFTREFKLEVIKRSYDDIKITDLGRELNIRPATIYRWRSEFIEDQDISFSGRGIKRQTEEQAEVAKLRKQLADVKMERDILKKAVGIFSKAQ